MSGFHWSVSGALEYNAVRAGTTCEMPGAGLSSLPELTHLRRTLVVALTAPPNSSRVTQIDLLG